MPNDKQVLLVRPVLNDHGEMKKNFFETLAFSLGLLVKQASLKTDYRILDLPAYSATRLSFEKAIADYKDVKIIVFLGHGSGCGDHILGFGLEELLNTDNIHLGEAKGLYFVCCHTAKLLGELAVRHHGARYFIGFDDKFYLVQHGSESIVGECALSGLFALMEGETPTSAWTNMQLYHTKKIEELETEQMDLDPNWFVAAGVLRSNMAACKLIPNDK